MRNPTARLLLAIPLLAWACSEDPGECGSGVCFFKADPQPVSLLLRVPVSEVVAGNEVTLGCQATLDDGSKLDLDGDDAAYTVSPEAPLEGAVLRPTKVGRLTLSCTAGALTSPEVELTVLPGPAARTVATLDRSTITSGERVNTTCTLEDEHGNAITPAEMRVAVSPSSGTTVTGTQLEAIRVGTYEVSCAANGFGALPRVPATLTVNSGAAVRLEVVLSAAAVLAGERVEVNCVATDAAGNAVTAPTNFLVSPAPTTADARGFAAEQAGPYDVVCDLPSANLMSNPARVTVGPGPAAQLVITGVDPTLPVYPRSAVVEVLATVTDAYGNVSTSASWDLSGSPSSAVQFAGQHRAQLMESGPITLTAQVTSPTAGGIPVSASVTVTCDAEPPVVIIDSPARGAILAHTPGTSLTVSGHVTDPTSSVVSFTFMGDPIALAPDGSFSATFVPRWGINLLEAIAIDEAGNSRELAQSFEAASNYRRASPTRTVSGRIDDGLLVRLSQAALDDNAADVDDLATILRLAIQQADLNALIPDPATNFHSDCSVLFVTITGNLRLWVDDVRFGTPIIDLTAQNGGLHLRAEIPNLAVDLHTTGDVCEIGVGISGTASAQRAVLEADLTVSHNNGNITVTMPRPSVQLYGFNLNLNLPSIIDWAVDGILSLFSGVISDEVEDALADTLQAEVPGLVDDFLTGVELGTSVQLPAPISLNLGIGARLGSLSFSSSGGTLGFDATVYAQGTISPEPLGGILRESITAPNLTNRGSFVVAMSYDLVNQALYSIWYGGAFNLDLTQFLSGQVPSGGGNANVSATTRALLPPVVGRSGDPNFPLQLMIGDLQIDANFSGLPGGLPPLAATIYATAFAKARVNVNGQGQITFELAPNPEVVLDFTSPLDAIDLQAFITDLETAMAQYLPTLFNQAIQGIPIPTLDLSSLAGSVLPAGIRLGLGSPVAESQTSYVVLGGALVPVP